MKTRITRSKSVVQVSATTQRSLTTTTLSTRSRRIKVMLRSERCCSGTGATVTRSTVTTGFWHVQV